MHTRFGTDYLEFVTHIFLNRFDQGSSPLRVQHAHSADVAREVSFYHPARESGALGAPGAVPYDCKGAMKASCRRFCSGRLFAGFFFH